MVRDLAVFILGRSALPLALKLKAALQAEIFGPDDVEGIDHGFGKATVALQSLFGDSRPIIALCASGIVIRAMPAKGMLFRAVDRDLLGQGAPDFQAQRLQGFDRSAHDVAAMEESKRHIEILMLDLENVQPA